MITTATSTAKSLPIRSSYDAVVIGARCAGASTAMLLARNGLRVLLVDKGSYGKDTLSTHALMRPAVLQLQRWGLLDKVRESGAPAIRTTTFNYGDEESVEVEIKARDGVDALYSPRRTHLDALLVDAARAAGVDVRYRVKLAGLRFDARGRVVGASLETQQGVHDVRAGMVVGADGLNSTVARLLDDAPEGAESPRGTIAQRSGHQASFVIYGYFRNEGIEGNQWYYRGTAGAGATPTNDGVVCAFVATSRRWVPRNAASSTPLLFRALLGEAAPALASRLQGAAPVGPFYRFAGAPGHMRRAAGAGWMLVGDAGYFRDPITAHGISDALRDAELAARAIVAGRPSYQHERDALALEMFHATESVASYGWRIDELKRLHLAMSQTMKREGIALSELDGVSDGFRLRASGPTRSYAQVA